MQLLVLGGNSPRNQTWINQVASTVARDFSRVTEQQYRHWSTGDPDIDLDFESSQLGVFANAASDYQIFAKSAGSILTLRSIDRSILDPQSAVFAGLPLVMIERYTLPINTWLKSVHCPVIILQNDQDPYGSYDQVATLVAAAHNPYVTVQRLTGDSHDYDDFAVIQDTLSELR